MNTIFTAPYYYLNDVGLHECLLLHYFVHNINSCTGNIASFTLNKSELCKKSTIKFMSESDVQSGMNGLFDSGFVFFHKKSGKKTRKFSINIVNMVLFETLGSELYKSLLSEFDNGRYCGKVIPIDSVSAVDINIQDRPSMTEKGGYISLSGGEQEVFDILSAVYRFDVRKLSKHVKNNMFVPSVDGDKLPCNVESMFAVAPDSPLYNIKEKYKVIAFGGGVVVSESQQSDDQTDEDSNSEEVVEVSKKDLARNDYLAYCDYMKVKTAMRKPINQWTARDFVAYLYCGIAKTREKDGDFVFPNFARECTQMKRVMEKYGNKRLSKIIFHMVKNTDVLVEYCGFNDFHLSIYTLNIDWMMNKMWDFVQDFEEREQLKKLREQKLEHENNKKSEQKTEIPLDKSVSGDILNKYRESFNK